MPHSLCVSVLHRKMHNDEKKQNNNQIDRSQPQLNLFKTDISHYNQNIKFKIYLNYYHCLFFSRFVAMFHSFSANSRNKSFHVARLSGRWKEKYSKHSTTIWTTEFNGKKWTTNKVNIYQTVITTTSATI